MSPLLVVSKLKKSYGAKVLFSDLQFAIEPGERIGLIGPNGAGKSSLLKILAAQEDADQGQISRQQGLKLAFLEQQTSFEETATVFSTLVEKTGSADTHESQQLARKLISQLQLPEPETPVHQLSGGWKKRLALARELMLQPELVLLDEPTNHLDIEGILWLEEFLSRASFASLTITHDRSFLKKVANRIFELDRRNTGGLLRVRGNFERYLQIKEEQIRSLRQQQSSLQNTYTRELAWLKRGAKARTTKQEARIQRAGELKSQLSELQFKNQNEKLTLELQSSGRQPKRLIEAKRISQKRGDQLLFENLELILRPGDRLGILGQNGCGKTTLIQSLLGKLPLYSGKVQWADKLSVAYFDQDRNSLELKLSLVQNLCRDGETVEFQGKKIHVRSYLDRFLFKSEQLDLPVGALSGGEQSRLLIARLLLESAQVYVFDEPTNDLDLSTLEVLEECLLGFSGAILLVSHDRYFLERVSTRILAFPPNSIEHKEPCLFSDLKQWEIWRKDLLKKKKEKEQKIILKQEVQIRVKKEIKNSLSKKKLTFKEQKELGEMENNIQTAESQLLVLNQALEKQELNRTPASWQSMTQEIASLQTHIELLYQRWSELEEQSSSS